MLVLRLGVVSAVLIYLLICAFFPSTHGFCHANESVDHHKIKEREDALADEIKKTGEGLFGRAKTFLGRSEVARLCRVTTFGTLEDAVKHMRLAMRVCRGSEYNKAIEIFCKKQCSIENVCMKGCGVLCKDWLVSAERSAKSQDSVIAADGVRSCIYNGQSAGVDSESHFYAFKDNLDPQDAKTFSVGEEYATKAGEDFAKSLIKVCVLLRKATKAREKMDGSKRGAGWAMLEGMYKRMHARVRGESEAVWSAQHAMWSLDNVLEMCQNLEHIVDSAYKSIVAMVEEEQKKEVEDEDDYNL